MGARVDEVPVPGGVGGRARWEGLPGGDGAEDAAGHAVGGRGAGEGDRDAERAGDGVHRFAAARELRRRRHAGGRDGDIAARGEADGDRLDGAVGYAGGHAEAGDGRVGELAGGPRGVEAVVEGEGVVAAAAADGHEAADRGDGAAHGDRVVAGAGGHGQLAQGRRDRHDVGPGAGVDAGDARDGACHTH